MKRILSNEVPVDQDQKYVPLQTTGSLYGTVWIDVETNPSSSCSWDNYSFASNCEYLGQLVKAL
jgi:hypothetical protein